MATDTMTPPSQVNQEPAPQTATAPPPPSNGQALAPAKAAKERIQVHFNPDDPASLYMDTGIFEQLQRVALLMCRSNLVPEHLRGEDKVSDCFLVTAQAFRWRMDCFSVAQHTFVLSGKLGYEGKLIAGIINASGKLEHNLAYEYEGEGPGRKVTVIGALRGEGKARTVSGTVDAWSTKNEMWRKDPDQILSYRGAREWARRHMPEVMLGIYAEEELPAVEMTRGQNGTFSSRRDASAQAAEAGSPGVRDALLEAVGIVAEPEIVLVPPQETKAPVKDCPHACIPPSRLKPGKTMTCVDCGEELHGDPIQ